METTLTVITRNKRLSTAVISQYGTKNGLRIQILVKKITILTHKLELVFQNSMTEMRPEPWINIFFLKGDQDTFDQKLFALWSSEVNVNTIQNKLSPFYAEALFFPLLFGIKSPNLS